MLRPNDTFDSRLSIAEFRARIDSLLAEAARELNRTRELTDRMTVSVGSAQG